MLNIVTDMVIDVMASFRTKVAVPNDAGLGAPVEVVGTVGGISAAFVRFAVRIVAAWQYPPTNRTIEAAIPLVVIRNIFFGVPLQIDSPGHVFIQVESTAGLAKTLS